MSCGRLAARPKPRPRWDLRDAGGSAEVDGRPADVGDLVSDSKRASAEPQRCTAGTTR